jgi:hypothetical protein
MYTLDRCVVCEKSERTLIAEYNRLIAVNDMWQSDLARSDYMLCHYCGLVYASRRPDRAEYEFLYANFNEFLARDPIKLEQNIFNVPEPLDAGLKQEIDDGLLRFWELRKGQDGSGRVRAPALFEFNGLVGDLPDLLLNKSLEHATVLQVRGKTALFADLLVRVFGAKQVDLLTLFPVHQYAAESMGFRAVSGLDYGEFAIPFDNRYDVIIETHVFIHMLDPAQTFSVLRKHLNDGGALVVRKESDDVRLFNRRRNLFSELRPFHFQQFDIPVLARMLRRFGFEPLTLRHPHPKKSDLTGVAAAVTPTMPDGMGAEELASRLAMYRAWREESIVSLPRERSKALFGDECDEAHQRVAARGGLAPDKKGRPKAQRLFAEMQAGD